MKMRNRQCRGKSPIYWKPHFVEYRVPIATKALLPRIGRPAVLYITQDTKKTYLWHKGKWFIPTVVIEKVRPVRHVKGEFRVQPLTKHLENLPISTPMDFSKFA